MTRHTSVRDWYSDRFEDVVRWVAGGEDYVMAVCAHDTAPADWEVLVWTTGHQDPMVLAFHGDCDGACDTAERALNAAH